MRVHQLAPIALLCLIANNPAEAAKGPHYTYLQAAWVNAEIEEGGHDLDGDGIIIDASVSATKHLFVLGEYARIELEDDDLEEVALGAGAHRAIGKSTDVVGHLVWLRESIEHNNDKHVEEGWGALLGVRSHLSAAWEVEGGIAWTDLGHGGDASVVLGARWYPTPILSFGVDVEAGDDVTLIEAGVRLDF